MARSFRPFAGAEGSGYFPRKGQAVNGVSKESGSAAEGALADAGGVALEVDAGFVGATPRVTALLESAEPHAEPTDAIEALLAHGWRAALVPDVGVRTRRAGHVPHRVYDLALAVRVVAAFRIE